ncbi:MAG: ribosomal RNA small subunit methyltransferase A [Bryobacterales bacterium]|nr:ribosomal RNA small subunit methyltransferase A [Bryobacterales bacterium]
MGQRLGQHFLVRTSILEKIARAACPERESLVIEIGPGKGALTRYLEDRTDRLVAIELDTDLAAQLPRQFPAVEVLHADVLQVDLNQWGPAVVAGNLPYYITSPILDRTLALGPNLKRAVFLVQKEVAERMLAGPGSRDYGYLSVRTQLLAEGRLVAKVPPGAFQPPPQVDSAVVALTPRSQPLVEDTDRFLRFAAASFTQKRKNLRNNLGPLYPGIDGRPEARLRAEQMSLRDMIDLWRSLDQGTK